MGLVDSFMFSNVWLSFLPVQTTAASLFGTMKTEKRKAGMYISLNKLFTY